MNEPGQNPDRPGHEPTRPSLTPDHIERVLADFRAWLEEAVHESNDDDPVDKDPASERQQLTARDDAEADEDIDLATVVGQFTALRHEVNLQTRASRNLQEQQAQSIQQILESLDRLDQDPVSREPENDDERLRPLLKGIIDAHDALTLACIEVERSRRQLAPLLAASPPPASEPLTVDIPVPWWARLLGWKPRVTLDENTLGPDAMRQLGAFGGHQSGEQQARDLDARQLSQTMESILVGYTMSIDRLRDTLERYDLEPIEALGEPFDPETMEVLDVVVDAGRPSGEVVDVLRPGYLWQGRIFRFAQVRVAKNSNG